MTERPNKELALRYYSDDTLKAWWWYEDANLWTEENPPDFDPDYVWHVGHEAPTKPPTKMCELAGIKFPMPMREAPKIGDEFWFIALEGAVPATWDGSALGFRWLDHFRCHKTREAAEQHYNALCAAMWRAIEGAK